MPRRDSLASLVETHRTWIQRHQTPRGGFLASLNYRPYQKVWLRDHALVALALLRWHLEPEVTRAARFSAWILEQEAFRMEQALALDSQDPRRFSEEFHPRARYWPDGSWVREPWAERQYDGVALNLWFLTRLGRETGNLPISLEVLEIGLRYLQRFWQTPCAGPWEMDPGAVHTWTVAAIGRAFREAKPWFPWAGTVAQEIQRHLQEHLGPQGLPRKMRYQGRALGWDAATLPLFLDFEALPADDGRAARLLDLLDRWLSPDGLRLRRFIVPETGTRDRYFGGGPWVITSVWAARLALKLGHRERALRLLRALPQGPLPEQWPEEAWDPAGRFFWILKSRRENAGAPGPAQPLAWSHAEVLNLLHDLLVGASSAR